MCESEVQLPSSYDCCKADIACGTLSVTEYRRRTRKDGCAHVLQQQNTTVNKATARPKLQSIEPSSTELTRDGMDEWEVRVMALKFKASG